MWGSCLGVSVGAAHVSGLVGGVVEIGVVPAGPEVPGGRCRLSDAPQHLVEVASVGSGAVGPAAEVWVEGGDRRSVLAVVVVAVFQRLRHGARVRVLIAKQAVWGGNPDGLSFEGVKDAQRHDERPPEQRGNQHSRWVRKKRSSPLTSGPQYTTLLRAIELWGAVQADGPGRLASDEEPPATNGRLVSVEQDFSQQIKADPEDRLSTAFVGLDNDRPVFRLPFTGRVGERKGYGQHSE